MDVLRRFATTAPALRDFREDKPTLLVSWWCTFYAVTIILFRVCGRYIRTEKIFLEDGIMVLAIVPLLLRMAFVHVVLLYGTNNTDTTGLTALEISHRETGSQLVLASRIMYPAYLWMIKYSVSIYLRTLTESVWQRSHQKMLRYLHIFLALSFIGTVVGDLGACHPFSHYWQVVPDPGPQCRQGYTQLLTFGILNILTNIALVLFPIPMILKARIDRKQKILIILRMALPSFGVILTLYQLPTVTSPSHLGRQQFRSLVASFDILLATFAANAVVLGSLLQDRGYKKTKYKHGDAKSGFNARRGSANDGAGVGERGFGGTTILHNRWGSDEDLMRTSSNGDKGSVMIGLEELPSSAESRKPGVPPKAKFPEIRVASTWEIHVDRRDAKE